MHGMVEGLRLVRQGAPSAETPPRPLKLQGWEVYELVRGFAAGSHEAPSHECGIDGAKDETLVRLLEVVIARQTVEIHPTLYSFSICPSVPQPSLRLLGARGKSY